MGDTAKHCDHCSWSCKNDKLLQAYDHSSTDWKNGGEWNSGHCPACAERAKMAAYLKYASNVYRKEDNNLEVAVAQKTAYNNIIDWIENEGIDKR